MSKNEHLIKRGIFLFLIGGLLLCMLQWKFGFIEVEPLKGDVREFAEPKYSNERWMSGEYQKLYDNYFEHNIGFRPSFVRLNNQLSYSVFQKPKAYGVVAGKEGYLFEENYIKAYTGRDFLSKDSIDFKLWKLKFLQDELKKKGVDLFIAFAPGKASYYPEYIADKFQPEKKSLSNYEYYSKRAKELEINHLDFNKWFKQAKDTTRYLLYPKNGIHWSMYGVTLATDSLIHYMEDLRGIDMRELIIDSIELSTIPQKTDNDIEDGMNLMFELDRPEMAYPLIRWEDDPNKPQPKVLTIADSYFWNMLETGVASKSFSWGSFWFYFKAMYPETWEDGRERFVQEFPLKPSIEKNDFVMLMATEANLWRFAYKFIDEAFEVYSADYLSIRKAAISQRNDSVTAGLLPAELAIALPGKLENPDLSMVLYENPVLYKDFLKRADTLQVSIDDLIKKEINRMLPILTNPSAAFNKKVLAEMAKIRSDDNWMAKINQKAAERGISVEEMLRQDAEWIVKQQEKNQ